MAEAFARVYGSDVLIPASAGLYPAGDIASDTIQAMDERGIDIREHFPKTIQHLGRVTFDLAINISGRPIPEGLTGASEVRAWNVEDPICLTYKEHCQIRDEIERLVMALILELRRRVQSPKLHGFRSGRTDLAQ